MKTATLALLLVMSLPNAHRLCAQIVSGPVTNSNNGHVYYLVGPTSWTNAEDQAVSLGGHLATIRDAAENEWVLQTFGSLGNLFIGFTDDGHEGRWTWVSGAPVTYTNWNSGEPNNGIGVFPYENVSMMYAGADPRAGFWNDIMGFLSDQQYWGVVEVAVAPRLSIRVSQVEICWPTTVGVTYQLQYRSELTTNIWQNLGSPAPGTGSPVCQTDSVLAGEPQRYYQVIVPP